MFQPFVPVDVAVPVCAKLRTERPPENVDVAVVVAFTEPKYPALPRTTAAKELVEVALVVVEKDVVKPPLKARAVEVALEGKGYPNDDPLDDVMQIPLIAKQPPARLIPPVP